MYIQNQLTSFFIGIVEGGVQLGPLNTTAANCPIVPTLGGYDGGEISGMMIDRGNQSSRRKPDPVPLGCHSANCLILYCKHSGT
jgi:hypothetical protein